MRKIFTAVFALQILISFAPSYSNSVYTPEEIKQLSNIPVKIHFNGENYYSDNLRFKIENEKSRIENYISSEDKSSAWASEIQLNSLTRNYYDLQSNGTPQLIWRNPNNLDDIHVIYTSSQQSSGWTDRNVDYYYSSDAGITWTYIGPVAYGYVAGFGAISGLSNGIPLIAANAKLISSSITKTVIFADAFPGLGSFTSLTPEGNYLYPRITGGENVSMNENKFCFIASTDTLKHNLGRSYTSINFAGYNYLGRATGESYCIARGSGGLVGIAYVMNDNSTARGDVFFKQSTDYGESFVSGPVRIFDSNFNTDSLGGFKGISMLYKENIPYVAFETVKQTTDGFYFPGAPSKIRLWNSTLPAGTSYVIADENNVPYAPARGTTDLEAPICRPTLGLSTDDSRIYCAMTVQNAVTGGNDTTSFNDIFICYSNTNGFSVPKRANSPSPRYDWSFPVLSNLSKITTFTPYINLVAQRDIIPGSNVNRPNSQTDAKFYYLRADITANTLPLPPDLLSPLNNSTNVNTNPVFSWDNAGEFSDIQISSSIEFTNIIHSTRITSSSYSLPQGILNINTSYYWRVRNSRNGELTTWSYAYRFTTRTTSVNNISVSVPAQYKLYNNYPNPFNPVTKIKFDLPKSSFVKITVFDITGKIVSELANEILEPGSYETDFNGANLSSGIYYYRIEAQNFIETRKMILLK